MRPAGDPVVEGEVIGFRRWQVDGRNRPKAIINDCIWAPGTNTAKCYPVVSKRPCWHAPGLDCHCGWNAYHDLGKLAGHVPLCGIVVGWGSVYVHQDAWRAEFARCVAVIDCGWTSPARIAGVPPSGKANYEAVARYFGVPVVKLEGAEAFAGEYGSRVPAELIPEEPRDHSVERGPTVGGR